MPWRTCLIALLGVQIVSSPAFAYTYIVKPDGTGDLPTIQAAIDISVDGDLILLTDGVFAGDGNRDIEYRGKAITVRSQSGDPQACIIDCEGSEIEYHRGFYFLASETADTRLEGVTIKNGVVGGED